MSKSANKKPLAAVIGATFATSLSAAAVSATENPFALKDLAGGYMVAEGEQPKTAKEGACGEGKCGAQMMKQPEMKCGAGMKKEDKAKEQKAMEGKCAGMKMDGAAPTGGVVVPPAGEAPKAQ